MPAFWLVMAKIAIKKRQTHLWIAVRPSLRWRPLEIGICADVGLSMDAARASGAATRRSRVEAGPDWGPPYDGVARCGAGADAVRRPRGIPQTLVAVLVLGGLFAASPLWGER